MSNETAMPYVKHFHLEKSANAVRTSIFSSVKLSLIGLTIFFSSSCVREKKKRPEKKVARKAINTRCTVLSFTALFFVPHILIIIQDDITIPILLFSPVLIRTGEK